MDLGRPDPCLRPLPSHIILDVTRFMNFVSGDQWTKRLNLMDPRLTCKYGAALNATVANLFCNYATVDTFPGCPPTADALKRLLDPSGSKK